MSQNDFDEAELQVEPWPDDPAVMALPCIFLLVAFIIAVVVAGVTAPEDP